ncbi:hypothetical protein HHSLTHF2_30190 [Vreelandella venusta]|jgi:hypothetical protein|uniref:Uncharacterized protein n=1 Tax=Halomonas hydrothermalis TaxID=115561 RepID=A0A6F8U8I2_9GAMM|nr:hypothetical protein HHSLTHF2_30190 [Halomonas hydrothermalis]
MAKSNTGVGPHQPILLATQSLKKQKGLEDVDVYRDPHRITREALLIIVPMVLAAISDA